MLRLRQLRVLHRFLCNVVILGVVAAAGARASEPAVVALEDVEPGQLGYGLSVFSGSTVERFDVEVLGVWRNLRPRTSYVLARLSGQGLEDSGVIAGMSGSPVYIDGKLLGAVSFGWPFSNEAIAGITPAGSMRSMLSQPGAPAPAASLEEAWSFQRLATGELTEADLRRSLAALRPVQIGEAAVAIEWTSAGFGPRVRSLLEEEMGTVAAAGSVGVADSAPTDLEPGGAVAAVLVDGDLRLASTGTVTDRTGNMVLGFGHPFLGLGSLDVPMASAEILTVVSSQWSSFKVANLGPVVGAIDFDYLTGIRGTVGKAAKTVPMTVRLNDSGDSAVELSLAKIPTLTPVLAAISVLGALDATPGSAGAQSLDLRLDFDLGDDGALSIDQSFDGPGASLGAAIHVFSMTSYLLRNSLADVDIRKIDVDLRSHREPRTLTLVGAHPARSVVRPGETLTLNVDLAAYRDGKLRRQIEVAVPSDLAAGRFMLLIGDGRSTDAVRIAFEQIEPKTFRQALEFLNSLHSSRDLRVLGIVEGPGLSVAGEVLPELPGSIRSLWTASGSGAAKPLRMTVAEEAGTRLEEPIEGLLRVDIEIERSEPVAGEKPPATKRPMPGARPRPATQGGDG